MKIKHIVIASSVVMLGGAFAYKQLVKGVDVKSMDKKANPRSNFNQFANGNWMKNNPVPSTESRWTSFNILAERNFELVHTILKNAANDKTATVGSNNLVSTVKPAVAGCCIN